MSRNKTKKAKFNAIDGIIILLVLACIASLAYKAFVIGEIENGTGLSEYRVYFKIDDIKSTSADYFLAGDIVRVKSSEKVMGVLDGIVQHIPAVGAYNENGEEIFYPDLNNSTIYDETRYSLVGYITVKGEMTESGFLLNGESYIAPNSIIEIVTDKVESSIRIISINEK